MEKYSAGDSREEGLFLPAMVEPEQRSGETLPWGYRHWQPPTPTLPLAGGTRGRLNSGRREGSRSTPLLRARALQLIVTPDPWRCWDFLSVAHLKSSPTEIQGNLYL